MENQGESPKICVESDKNGITVEYNHRADKCSDIACVDDDQILDCNIEGEWNY